MSTRKAKAEVLIYTVSIILYNNPLLQILLPALRKISTVIEVGDLPVCQLLTPDQVVPSEEVLVTFTTGSTGMPKLLARDHSFVLNQSKALSTFYKDNDELVLDETTSVFATNLPVFPLHFLRVSEPLN